MTISRTDEQRKSQAQGISEKLHADIKSSTKVLSEAVPSETNSRKTIAPVSRVRYPSRKAVERATHVRTSPCASFVAAFFLSSTISFAWVQWEISFFHSLVVPPDRARFVLTKDF